MVTQTGICNSALAKVGQGPIASIDQDTRAAQIIKSIFDLIQDEVMTSHPWNFAIKRVKLIATATTPTFEYQHEFDVPNDCLRVLSVNDDCADWFGWRSGAGNWGGNQWVVEGKKILCDDSEAWVRYIFRNVDYNSWSSPFAEVMAWRIAMDIAYALTQSSDREKACAEKYEKTLSLARSTDGMEGTLKPLIADEWIDSRWRFGRSYRRNHW